jgi:hypothetical protein
LYKTTGAVGYIFGSISGPFLITLIGAQRVFVLYGVIFLMFAVISFVVLPSIVLEESESLKDGYTVGETTME